MRHVHSHRNNPRVVFVVITKFTLSGAHVFTFHMMVLRFMCTFRLLFTLACEDSRIRVSVPIADMKTSLLFNLGIKRFICISNSTNNPNSRKQKSIILNNLLVQQSTYISYRYRSALYDDFSSAFNMEVRNFHGQIRKNIYGSTRQTDPKTMATVWPFLIHAT